MSRITIAVVVGDKQILDDYIIFMLREVRRFTSRLIVTINGSLSQGELNKIIDVTDTVIQRANKGYDCGAYKDTIENCIGWEEILKYDELLLMNDSCFGPLYDLNELFESMKSRNLDFWGITEQPPAVSYTH